MKIKIATSMSVFHPASDSDSADSDMSDFSEPIKKKSSRTTTPKAKKSRVHP